MLFSLLTLTDTFCHFFSQMQLVEQYSVKQLSSKNLSFYIFSILQNFQWILK